MVDPINKKEIEKALSEYFELNNTGDVAPITTLEAHKCVIHGKLMSITAKLKRIRQQTINSLIEKIRTLKLQHKLTRAQSAL